MKNEEDMPLVVFTPSGRRGHLPVDLTLLDAARALGVDLDSVCGGRGICGRCQVEPTFGSFSKHGISSVPTNLSEVSEVEDGYRGRRLLTEGRRLGCAARVRGDLVVDVPPDSQVHRQVVRKSVDLGEVQLDPVLVLRFLEMSDSEQAPEVRILEALAKQWEMTELEVEDGLGLVEILDAYDHVTVAVRDGHMVVAVWPDLMDRALGVAVDVGSTTIAAHLCDLATGEVISSAGTMNPQIRFGEDLMSRVSYVMMNPAGEVELTSSVRQEIDGLFRELCTDADAQTKEILELVVVGNPIMHHLFLGLDPTPLGVAPFDLQLKDSVDLLATDLDLDLHPAARVHVLPCVAGHVGADMAAVVLATRPHHSDGVDLVVDVGTNAEVVLAGNGRVLAASSPTGPAFEGAQISSGQRATVGAIERVRIDAATGIPRFRVIGVDMWSDDPGFEEAVSTTGISGICGSGIIEVVAELRLANLMTAQGVIGGDGTMGSPYVQADGRTFSYVLYDPKDGGTPILVTQNDVRAVQLAKAALFAGIRLLMENLDVGHLDSVSLAGAFGSHIDPLRASVLGLIPDCAPEAVMSVGNAAGAGAIIALLSGEARREIQEVVKGIEKIETATEDSFQQHFVDAMAIPHGTIDFPLLRTRVALPLEARTDKLANVRPRRRRNRNRREKVEG